MDFIRMTLCVVCLTGAVNSDRNGRLPATATTVEVVLQGPSLIRVLDEAVVSATIRHPSSDVAYKFSWDFGDDDGGRGSQWTTILKTNATSSVASHKYGVPGEYTVRVNASTGGPSTVLSSRLAAQLSVVEPIKYVRLRPLLDVYGAAINRVSGTTDPVAFEAWTYHGGSHVQFAFDFGDGRARQVIVRGHLDVMRSVPVAQATHVYTNVGSYKVSVTAFNPLGNRSCSMSAPFVVQRLDLDRSYYVTSPNNVTRFGVTLQNDEDGVTYDWNFGNGVTFIGTGAEVLYAYPVSGTFEVTVNTTSFVPIRTSGRVFVLQLLEGVRVKIASNSSRHPVFATDQSVEFVAELSPTAVNIGTRVVFHWRWIIISHGLDKERNSHGGATRTIVGRLTNTFVNEGRYSLWVRADNSVSESVSERFQFDVLRPITGLRRIQHSGSVVLGVSVLFRARYWYGSNVTLHWNFGDGDADAAPISSSLTDHIRHFYNRTGEFRVSVRLTNALSDAEMTSVIFVVNERCDKPEVTILGVNEYDKLKIRRSGILRLGAGGEGGSRTMCDAATAVNHTWHLDPIGPHNRLAAARRLVFNGRMLTLSLADFDLGTYNVSLKVQLVGTIVYATATTSFEVLAERSTLKILGGSGRLIGRSQTVVLRVNASLVSNTSPERFWWRCSPLGKPKTDCGILSSVSDHISDNQLLATSELPVSASNLDLQFSLFLFTFMTSPANARASQLIEISPAAKTLDLMVTCDSCVNGEVAFKQDSISLVVQCASCSSEIVYEWQVWLVHDGKQNLPISDHDCVNPDGSTFFLNASSSSSNEDEEDLGFNSTSLFNYTAGDVYQTPGSDSVDWLPTEEVDWLPNRTSIDVARFDGEGGRKEWNPIEGFADDTGSVSARRFSSVRDSDSSLYAGSVGAHDAKSVRPVKALKSTADHILKSEEDAVMQSPYAREWSFVHLGESDTLSGFRQKQFHLKPDVLRIGRTYVFVVLARAGSTDALLQGKASQEVTLSLGPANGRCSLMPLVGREYETHFKLNCYEWKATVGDDSAKSAIFYELSYSLSDDEGSNVLLYYGLDNNFKFVLPAGLSKASHKVTLNVFIWQESGSNTVVCSIPRTVLPLGQLPNSTVSHILSRELVVGARSNISVLLKWSDFGGALNRIQVLASVLNRVEPVLIGDVQVQSAHRKRLLKLLFKGHLTNSAEALQLLHAIHEIYRQPETVDFGLARSSLKALRKASKFYWSFNATCKPFCWRGLGALFHATNAVLENVLLSDLSVANGTRLLDSAFTVLQKTLASRLSANWVKNDAASVLPLRASALTFNAVCAHLDAARSVALDGIQVTLLNGSVTESHCLLSLVSRAVYGRSAADNGPRTAFSTMTSVRISSSCDAEVWLKENAAMVAVDILPVPILIINVNVSSSSVLGTHHTLSTDQMNVHEFKLPPTIRNNNSMLSVTLRFSPTSDMSAVLLLLSDHYPPSLKNSIARRRVSVVPGTSVNLTFFDDHSQLKGLISDTSFYLALFDTASLRSTAFSSSVNSAAYLLNVQLVDCLQWNSESDSWIGSGCQIEPLARSIRCRCDQLSSYTATWRTLETVHTVASLDHVIGRRLNPFVPVVLIVCLTVYIVLCSSRSLWTIHMSTHRCGAVYLADNPPNGRHFYAVTLQTGRCSQSGTTAKVYVVLYGDNGTSEPRELTVGDDLQSGVFQRGSLNTFLLTSPFNLGRIFKVQIWHDNSGMSPAWFLDHVIVENVQRGEKQYFDCHLWLAIERDDGKIEREIHVEESVRRLLSFQRLFVSLHWTIGAFTGWPVLFGRLDSGHITHDDRTLIAALSVSISSVLAAIACRQDLQFTQFSGIFELPQPSLELLAVSCYVASIGFAARVCLAIVLHFSKLRSCVSASKAIAVNDDRNGIPITMTNEKNYSVVRPLTADEPIEKFSVLQDWAERQWLKNVVQYYSVFSSTSDSMLSNVSSIIGERTTAAPIEYPKGFSFVLPVTVRYFVWIMCVGAIFCSVTISIIIGVTFSKELSFIWLKVLLLSIAVDVSVFGPLLNAFGGVVFVIVNSIRKGFVPLPSVRACFCCCGDQKFEPTGFANGVGFGLRRCQSRKDEDDSFRRQCLAKKRSREARFARPPTGKQPFKYKSLAAKTMKMNAYLKELLASFFLFIVLAGAIFSQDNSAVYRLNRYLERTITQHKTMSLSEVFSRSTFLEWMEHEFVDVLYREDCGRNVTLCFRGTTSVVLGSVKMSRLPSSTGDTEVINLPRNKKDVTSLLGQLDHNEWVRNDTRQITLSFLLYNIPTKIFSSVTLKVRLSVEDASTVQVNSALLSAENYPLNVISSFSKVLLFSCMLFLTSCAFFKSRDQVKVIQILFLVALSAYFIASHYLAVTSQRILDNFQKKSCEDIELSSALIFKQVCAGLLGTAMILHLISSVCLLRVCPPFVHRFIRFILTYSVVTSVTVCVALIGFACLCSLEGGRMESDIPALRFLFDLLTGYGHFDGRKNMVLPVCTVPFFVFFFLAILNRTRFLVPTSYTENFSVDDLFQFVQKRICSSFARRHEKNHDTFDYPPKLSVEFLLAELESQVQTMCLMTSELSKLDVDDSFYDDDSDDDGDQDSILGVVFPGVHIGVDDSTNSNGNADEMSDYLFKKLVRQSSATSIASKFRAASNTEADHDKASQSEDIDDREHLPEDFSSKEYNHLDAETDSINLFSTQRLTTVQSMAPARRRIRRTTTRGKGGHSNEAMMSIFQPGVEDITS